MDHQTYSEIRKMLVKGLEAKDTQSQVTQNFKSIKDTANFFPNAQKIAPAYEYSHNLLFQTIKSITSPAPKILDLGAGIGRLSKLCLEAVPDCQITLLDVSKSLLEEASKQLSHFHGNFETAVGDFFSPDIGFSPASFDCIISAFAICHGRSKSDYREHLHTLTLHFKITL